MRLFGKDVIPCFVWIFHECDEINVIHERQAYHSDHLRKSAIPFYAARDDCQQQIGDEHYPSLYLYGIYTVSVKEMEREVLFQLFVERLYGSSEAIYLRDVIN